MAQGRSSGIQVLDAEIYRMHKEGEKDVEILEWVQAQGYDVDRTTVLRARQRAERNAVQDTQPEHVPAPDVEVTDDLIVQTILRDLAHGYRKAKATGDERLKLDHAKRIGELALVRHRLKDHAPEPEKEQGPAWQPPTFGTVTSGTEKSN